MTRNYETYYLEAYTCSQHWMQISSVGNLVSWIQIRIVLCSVLHGRKIYLQIKMKPCNNSCISLRGTWTTVRYLETWTCSQNGVKTGFVFYFVSKHLTVVLYSMFYVAEICLQNQFSWSNMYYRNFQKKTQVLLGNVFGNLAFQTKITTMKISNFKD